jgi:hypothetical protein
MGRRFCDATDIIKNATEELTGFHKMASSNVKTPLQWLADVYEVEQGDCFEGNVAYIIVLYYFVFVRNKVIPGNILKLLYITRRSHFACWITKATNANSEYVILTAFTQQQWLREGVSLLHYTYILCLIFLSRLM